MAMTYEPTAWAYAPITKVDDNGDGTVTVYGRPTQEVLDVDHQIADKAWVKEALPKWYQTGANVREMHQAKAVGKGTKLEFNADDDPFLTARIVEPVAVRLVQEGVLQGFSLGIKDPLVVRDVDAPNGRIKGGEIVEVSVVDRPAVPTAKIAIAKMVSPTEWVDEQSGMVLLKNNPTDGTQLNPEDFDTDGNPIMQPGHLQGPDSKFNGEEPQIISEDAHSVTVKVGDKVYQVPIDMDGQGNVVVGAPEEVPGILPAEGTTGNPESGAPGSSMKGVRATTKKTMSDAGLSFEQMQGLAEKRMDLEHANQEHGHHALATYPDKVIVGCGWRDGAEMHAVPFNWLDTADGDGDEDDFEMGKPYPVETKYAPKHAEDEKAVMAVLTKSIQILGKAVWTTEYIDDLPDSAFAYVAPGGKKEDRHLPYKDKDGNIDAAHVRNALARLDQTQIPEEAKQDAKKKLDAAAKEVGIEVTDEKKDAAPDLIKVALAGAKDQKVLCQQCKKTVTIAKTVEATPLAGGMRVSGVGSCGHAVTKFMKAAELESEEDKKKREEEEAKKKEGAQPPVKPQDKTDPDRAGGDDEDPETDEMDAMLGKFGRVLDAWAEKRGLFKDAAPEDNAKAEETRKRLIQDLRDAHKHLGDKIEEYAACDTDGKANDDTSKTTKGVSPNGGPARPDFNDPKEVVKELKGHLKQLQDLVEKAEEEMGHAAEDSVSHDDGHLGADPVAPAKKPAGDGRINFTTGDIKAAVADAVKSAFVHQPDSLKGTMPDLAKSVAEAVKGVLEPLTTRLERVEHMAQPSPFLVAAEKEYALNPRDENRQSAVKNVQAEMRKLNPKAQQEVIASAIAKDRGWM